MRLGFACTWLAVDYTKSLPSPALPCVELQFCGGEKSHAQPASLCRGRSAAVRGTSSKDISPFTFERRQPR